MNCILCTSSKVKIAEKIKAKQLIDIYHKTYNQDVSYIFKGSEIINYIICDKCQLNFFEPECAGEEKFYKHLQQYDWYYRPEKEEYDVAARFIKEGDKVLEVGAGFGAFTKYLHNVDYTGLEFSEDAIKMAKEKNITLINNYVENYANEHEDTFDIACHFQVLEHVTHPGKFLEACVKSLKKGGKLIFAVPSNNSFLADLPNHALDCPPHHMSRWPDDTLKYIPKMLHVKQVGIFHPKLEDIHHALYAKTVWQKRLASILGFKNKVVNQNKLYKALGIPAGILANLTYKNMVKKNDPISISVVAVYEKL